jgi:3-dehydroquinate synthase
MPEIVEVSFETVSSSNYQILISHQCLDQVGKLMWEARLGEKSLKSLIVSNPEIFRLYGDRLIQSLSEFGFEVASVNLPAGESYKTATSLQIIYDAALAHQLERSSVIVALGGGVVGDMAGFAAATWLRGLNLVQVPTSLLAMVDSAIGGKTGINHPKGKNLIGAFHQPRLVMVDPEVLATLPSREFRSAMAEIIKYGIIWDRELFEKLESVERLDRLDFLPKELLTVILYRCAKAKAEVVSQDEREGNLRAILNYGHTVGHAIEAATEYRAANHGEAVGLGMMAAGAIAYKLGLWTANDLERQNKLIAKAGLPMSIRVEDRAIAVADTIKALNADKKVSGGKVKFVLPTEIGKVHVSDRVTPALIETVVKETIEELLQA